MNLRIIIISIAVFCATGGFALISDFNGKYRKIPTFRDPWCGKSIEMQKIRFNKYRISWELHDGKKTVLELVGKARGDLLDFRSKKGEEMFGYTYALSDNRNRLIVTLTSPQKSIVCEFQRINGNK